MANRENRKNDVNKYSKYSRLKVHSSVGIRGTMMSCKHNVPR